MKNNAIKLLSDFVAIQSVSTDSHRHSEILKAADFLKKELKSLGFEVKTYQKEDCPPLIVATDKRATTRVAPTAKLQTLGIYAHYDVQPESPVEKWESPPFSLTERNGKLFGRGVADDKGHVIQILLAIHELVETQNFASLHNNIVLIFEGEEEGGSQDFEYLSKQAGKDLQDVDVFYVLDCGMKAKNIPQIYYGLRGIMGGELTVKIGESDLHSGIYGNRVLNPVQVIAELLTKIKDSQTNKIKIPGFYDSVKKVSQKEKDLLSEFILDKETEIKNAKIKAFTGDFLSSKILPSFEVNGMICGYTGEGGKTIIPAEAKVKFTIRLVPGQKPKEIKKIIKKFIENNLPKEVDFKLWIGDGSEAFYTDFDNPYTKKTAAILSEVFKNKTYFNRSGGSIAAAEILQRLFKKPVILTGFTLPDENIHAPNENIDMAMYEKGITTLEKILGQ